MKNDTKHINLQYSGFCNTNVLWSNAAFFELKQLLLPKQTIPFNQPIKTHLRLGKLAERFVFHQMKADDTIEIFAENIQIQREKLTLGELDGIIKLNNTVVHLEIVYKFYLYDERIGDTEIERWIGPNQNDSLVKKLSKLKEKQLPLLYTAECKTMLERFHLKAEEMEQMVHFKAQLFVPLHKRDTTFRLINNQCIQGFHVRFEELHQFSDSKFFIPPKLDWFMEVQTQTEWLSFSEFLPKVEVFLKQQSSPLCWIKHANGELEKFFVVWWT